MVCYCVYFSRETSSVLTVGARALTKHSHRDQSSSWWGVSTGSKYTRFIGEFFPWNFSFMIHTVPSGPYAEQMLEGFTDIDTPKALRRWGFGKGYSPLQPTGVWGSIISSPAGSWRTPGRKRFFFFGCHRTL